MLLRRIQLALCLAPLAQAAAAHAQQQQPSFPDARKAADAILAQPEFRTVTQQSQLETWLSRLAQFILQLLSRLAGLGRNSPWIATLLEWSLFALAAAAALVWAFRKMQRQQLAIALEASAATSFSHAESDNWADRARTEAAAHEWREAVHSLYWASIVLLEARKLWRPNRARTPREYLTLLEPGTPRRFSLTGLTRIFEGLWYGQRSGSQADYESALALFEELRQDQRRA